MKVTGSKLPPQRAGEFPVRLQIQGDILTRALFCNWIYEMIFENYCEYINYCEQVNQHNFIVKMLVWHEGLLETAKYVSSTSTEKYILIVRVVNQSSLIDWLEESHNTNQIL